MIKVDYKSGSITELSWKNIHFLSGNAPLFNISVRKENGQKMILSSYDAIKTEKFDDCCIYEFAGGISVTVAVELTKDENCATWAISVKNNSDMAVEYVDYPNISMEHLAKNGGRGKILLPYNEGVIIDDAYERDSQPFCRQETEYPSNGSYYIFPNMISSQFMAYLKEDCGVFVGAFDTKRGTKGFDYKASDDGVTLSVRNFSGSDFGENYELDYYIVTRLFSGDWEHAADIYREWFEYNLPKNVKKVKENKSLPDWYEDFPLVVAYPVRGLHDTDEMKPNALFPYINGLHFIDEIAKETQARVMALLMHWEGTAPWAPPYVWPPYGGVDEFNKFRDALHEHGHLLGVYCSGFGWTYKSNLDNYNCVDIWNSGKVESAMCAGPDGKVQMSKICPDQRSGYDLCPASPQAKKILKEAYTPLFDSGIDYAQILDQNHGGGQYLCYSREHGHPPMPGSWMTENMQNLLNEWNSNAPGMLFGCESAAAEPFIGNLLFSDNRFELNHCIGTPVPLYSYIYHEYLHNFMGNQVCCPLDFNTDTLCTRLAYSFSAGDCMTVVMMPDGDFLPHWGCRECLHPDKKKVLLFIRNLMKFYKEEAKLYLLYGRMEKAENIKCQTVSYPSSVGKTIEYPAVLTSAWSYDGKKVQIFINHTKVPQTVELGEKNITVDGLNGLMIEL